MSFLTSWVPSWMEGLYEIISHIGKLIWMILTALWAPIVFIVTLLVAIFAAVKDAWEFVSTNIAAAVAVLSSATDSMQTAVAAGWPPQFAAGVNYINQIAPLGETFVALMALLFLWIVCTVLRVVKSWIPTIG